jgi:DNA-binding transcriptional ArsR family regulator
MCATFDADIAYRARQLTEGGAAQLFADLHEDLEWRDGSLLLHGFRADRSVALGRHGLVLAPSAFRWPYVGIELSTTTQTTLSYSARGVGALWTAGTTPPAGSAVRLLGRVRTELLEALRAPATKTDLARALGVTPSAVAQHLTVLRESRLVAGERVGRSPLRHDRAGARTARRRHRSRLSGLSGVSRSKNIREPSLWIRGFSVREVSEGGSSVRVVSSAFDLDPVTLSPDARIDALIESEREIARVQARQVRVIAAIADDPHTGGLAPTLEKEYFKEELRAALGESAVSVNARLSAAADLVHRLPHTLAAVEAGAITMRHARNLVESVRALDESDARAVEAAALAFAAGRDFAAFCRKVRREVLKCDSRNVQEQVAAALADRKVWSRPADYGMSVFGALLPAEGAQVLMTALDVAVDRCAPDDPRTRDQQRADALVQLAIDALNAYASCAQCGSHGQTPDSSTAPRWQGLRPTIQVTSPASGGTPSPLDPARTR